MRWKLISYGRMLQNYYFEFVKLERSPSMIPHRPVAIRYLSVDSKFLSIFFLVDVISSASSNDRSFGIFFSIFVFLANFLSRKFDVARTNESTDGHSSFSRRYRFSFSFLFFSSYSPFLPHLDLASMLLSSRWE